MIATEHCAICYCDHDAVEMVHLSCGCTYCRSGLADWFLTQLTTSPIGPSGLTCPSAFRQHIITYSDVTFAFSSDPSYSALDTELARKLLARQSDVRSCPTEGCGYLGWVDSKQRCYSSLKCGKCGREWTDPSAAPALLQAYRTVKGWGSEDSVWTQIWLEAWTALCPSCSVPIEKSGGCYHMTCRHCGYEFCWYCLHGFHGHSELVCVLKLIYRYFLLILLPFITILKTGSSTAQLYDVMRMMVYYLFVFIVLTVEVRAHYSLGKSLAIILLGKGPVGGRGVQLCGFITMFSLLELLNVILFLLAGFPWHWLDMGLAALVEVVWAAPLTFLVYAIYLR